MNGEELARYAAALAGWQAGMRYRESLPCAPWIRVRETAERVREKNDLIVQDDDECSPVAIGVMLDLDDAASLGCLEGRLLAAWPGARITIDLDPWADAERHQVAVVEVRICPAPGEPCRSFFGRGEHARAEAIVAALEAAPRREPSA